MGHLTYQASETAAASSPGRDEWRRPKDCPKPGLHADLLTWINTDRNELAVDTMVGPVDRERWCTMLTRRTAMTMIGAIALLATPPGPVRHAWAQAGERAVTFVKSTSDQLVAIVNSAGSPAEKRRRLQEVLDATVDVDDIARFCLGRFWRIATPDQQTAIHGPVPRPSGDRNRQPSRRVPGGAGHHGTGAGECGYRDRHHHGRPTEEPRPPRWTGLSAPPPAARRSSTCSRTAPACA